MSYSNEQLNTLETFRADFEEAVKEGTVYPLDILSGAMNVMGYAHEYCKWYEEFHDQIHG